MCTTTATTSSATTARAVPKAMPSMRSTGRSPATVTSLRVSAATSPPAKAMSTNTSTKPAA